MAFKVLTDDAAHPIIVLECFDLLDLAKCIKGIVVQVVDFVDVRVRDDDVG